MKYISQILTSTRHTHGLMTKIFWNEELWKIKYELYATRHMRHILDACYE